MRVTLVFCVAFFASIYWAFAYSERPLMSLAIIVAVAIATVVSGVFEIMLRMMGGRIGRDY